MRYKMKIPVKAWRVSHDWPEWVKDELASIFPMRKLDDGVKIGNLPIPFGVWVVLLPNSTLDVRDTDDFWGWYEDA
jgi:hypothetical protein